MKRTLIGPSLGCLMFCLCVVYSPSGMAQEPATQRVVVQADARIAQEVLEDADAEIIVEPFVMAENPQLIILQKYVRVECALARRACNLTAEQERRLAKMNIVWLTQEVKLAEDSPIKHAMAGIARFLGGQVPRAQARNQPHQIVEIVRQKIDRELESLLDERQAAAYKQQRESRDGFRRQALAGVLVSALDRRLYMTEDQRRALLPLVAKWLTKDLYWQFYFQNDTYIPTIPKHVLSQVLDSAQVAALAGLQSWNYELDQIEMQIVGQQIPVVIEK